MTVRGSDAEAVVLSSDPPSANAQSAQRARSVARPVPLPLTTTTERDADRRRWRAVPRPAGLLASISSGDHMTGQLPSIAEAHKRIHRSAAKWDDVLVLKWLRLGWGYLWLCAAVVPAYFYVVVTEHPVITLIVAGLIVLARLYL